ncbi:hypothetical protein GCM10027452_04910 [Micromonospora halotolerans]
MAGAAGLAPPALLYAAAGAARRTAEISIVIFLVLSGFAALSGWVLRRRAKVLHRGEVAHEDHRVRRGHRQVDERLN